MMGAQTATEGIETMTTSDERNRKFAAARRETQRRVTDQGDRGRALAAGREANVKSKSDSKSDSELNKADALLIHGHEFLLLPLVAVVVGLVLALSAPAQASKWQGWEAWCNQHPTSHLPVCQKVTR